MKFHINTKTIREIDVKYMKIDADVHYWQDSDVNKTPDIDFYLSNGKGEPTMPFAVRVKETPDDHLMSDHYRWQPVIDLEEGVITGWPEGVTAHVHYKVCDEGVYTFFDTGMNEVIKVESYVPDFIGEFGDYIIMDVSGDGKIDNFKFTSTDMENIIKNDFNYN